MPDFKTLLLIAALGGGGPMLTYLGIAAPAKNESSELQVAAEIMGDELKACYARNNELIDALQECQSRCP